MSKKAAGRKSSPVLPRKSARRFVAAALIVAIACAGAALALFRPAPFAQPVAPSPASLTSSTAPASSQNAFDPSKPSKEYIHAGGRLVATEETVVKQNQTISFDAIANKTYGDAPFTVSASSSSGLPVSFAVQSGPAAISGNLVSLSGAGSVTISAEQAGDSSFNPAPPVTRTFSVAKAAQTISFDASQLAGKVHGSAPFSINAASSAGLPVTFTSSGGCTVSGNIVTITAAGPASITAVSAGNDDYEPAPQVSHSFVIAKASAAVNLSGLSHTYDGSAKGAAATTTPAGLTVNFTYSRDGAPVAAPMDAGSYQVTATVNDVNYDGAATGTLVISKASAALSLSGLNHVYDATQKSATVTTTPAGLGGVSLTYDGSATPPTNAGSYQVAAHLSHPNYSAADATGTLVITKATAVITLSGLTGQTYDGTQKAATVTTSPAGLATVSVTYNGSATPPTNAGSYQVAASLSNVNYEAAQAAGTLVINKAAPQINWNAPAQITYGTALSSAQLNASASFGGSALSGSFTYTPAAGTILNAGANQTLTVAFTPTDTDNFTSTNASVNINVLKATPTISWPNPADITHGTALSSSQLNASATFNGAALAGSFIYTPAAGAVLNVGNNQQLTVLFTPADSQNFNTVNASAQINVIAASAHSLSLNGSSYMEVANSPAINLTGAFTAEAWIKLNNSTGSYQSIMERFGDPSGSTPNGGFILRVRPDGKAEVYVLQSSQAGYPRSGNTVVTAGVWHHVAAVSDEQSIRLYINGQLDAILEVGAYPATGTSNLFIGRGAGNYGHFNGLIDEARITAASLYNSNFTPETNLSAGAATRGLWKFDGQSANDFSGNAGHATPQGSPAYSTDVPSLPYRSLSLDGVTGQMRVPHSASLDVQGPFTVETWFKIADNGRNQYLVSCLTGTGGFILMANDGMPQLYVTNSSGQGDFAIAWPSIITFGQWQHMAGVFDGNQIRVYLNGQLVAAKTTTIGPGSFAGSDLAIGGYQFGAVTAVQVEGQVDEVRVSAGAIYTTNFTPEWRLSGGPSTRGLWKFDGGTTQDSSSNGNHGVLRGGTSYSTDVP